MSQEKKTAPGVSTPPKSVSLSKAKMRAFGAVAVALGLMAALLALEVAVRAFLAARPNDIEALRRFEHAKTQSRDGNLTLIHFVRPSQNSTLVYELIPGIEGRFRNAPVKINSAGFRDREHSRQKPPNTFRIATLGDSIAFGWGVAQQARFTDRLEAFLNDTSTSHALRFEVLNFGVPGYNTVMEVEQFRTVGLSYDPDAVILSFVYDNDANVPNFVSKPRPLFTLTRSYALEMLRSRTLRNSRMQLEAGVQGVDPNNVPPEYHYLLGWDNVRRALGELGELCSARNLPILFRPDYWTVEPWRAPSPSPTDPASPIYAYVEKLGYLLANPKPEILRYVNEQRLHSYALCVAPDDNDAHPNGVGHALIAKVLYRRLVESAVLPDAAERRARLEQDLKRWDEIIAHERRSATINAKYLLSDARSDAEQPTATADAPRASSGKP